jgi:hypothetical protein
LIYADLARRYLFSLWPGVQILAQAGESEEDWSPQEETDYKNVERVIELINRHLVALERCNRVEGMKYDAVDVINEESWGECFHECEEEW